MLFAFNHLPRLGENFVLGSDSGTSDVTIGVPGRHISAQHLRFGFDQQDRVVMRDSSTLGTSVSYNNQMFQTRRGTLASRSPGFSLLAMTYRLRSDLMSS